MHMTSVNQYEAMILFDPTFAANEQAVKEEILRIMDRAEARDVVFGKWDDRRLAYKIKGRKRATYFITFFKAQGGKIAGLERDMRLSENILRSLIIRTDYMTPERMAEALKGAPKESPRESMGDGFGSGRVDYRDRGPRGEDPSAIGTMDIPD